MISSAKSIGSEKGVVREVEFRKSIFASQEKTFLGVGTPKVEPKKTGRKSCLKRSSFENIQV